VASREPVRRGEGEHGQKPLGLLAGRRGGDPRPAGGRVVSNLTYTLSTTAAGKAIDFLEGQGPGKSDLRQGIYKIEGDALPVSFTLGDAARPTSFDPANGNYVLVLKRVTK